MKKLLIIIALLNILIVTYLARLMQNIHIAIQKDLPVFDVFGGKWMVNYIWWIALGGVATIAMALHVYFSDKR